VEFFENLDQSCFARLESALGRQCQKVIDKMPGNFMYLGLISRVFPNAKIIHIKRNPIDTCLSIYFQQFLRGHSYSHNLEDLSKYYRQYDWLMSQWSSVLPSGSVLEVPYESLVDDPTKWTRKLLDHVGLDWSDACLEFHKVERRIGTASNWQARQPIYKTSKERWRNYEKYVGPLLPLLDLYDPAQRSA